MTGRFFALENFSAPSLGCELHSHDEEDENLGLGCDKCYWAYKRKNRPAVVYTLKAKGRPPAPPPEQELGMPVANPDIQLAFIRPSAW